MADILYKSIPEEVEHLILEKQLELTKKKKRRVSKSETITHLLKEAFLKAKD